MAPTQRKRRWHDLCLAFQSALSIHKHKPKKEVWSHNDTNEDEEEEIEVVFEDVTTSFSCEAIDDEEEYLIETASMTPLWVDDASTSPVDIIPHETSVSTAAVETSLRPHEHETLFLGRFVYKKKIPSPPVLPSCGSKRSKRRQGRRKSRNPKRNWKERFDGALSVKCVEGKPPLCRKKMQAEKRKQKKRMACSLDMSLLLLHPESRSFEVMELSFFETDNKKTMASDVVDAIPRCAHKRILRRQTYAGLLRVLQKDISSTEFRAVLGNTSKESRGGNVAHGDIMVAVPSGHSPERVFSLSLWILSKCGYICQPPHLSSLTQKMVRDHPCWFPRNEEELFLEGIQRAKENAATANAAVDGSNHIRTSLLEGQRGLQQMEYDDDLSSVYSAYSSWVQSFDVSFSRGSHRLEEKIQGSYFHQVPREMSKQHCRRRQSSKRILKHLRLLALGIGSVKLLVSALSQDYNDTATISVSHDQAMGVRGAFVLTLAFAFMVKLQDNYKKMTKSEALTEKAAFEGSDISVEDLVINSNGKETYVEWGESNPLLSLPCMTSSEISITDSSFGSVSDCRRLSSCFQEQDARELSWKANVGAAALVLVVLVARYWSERRNIEPLLTDNESIGVSGLCQCLALFCYLVKMQRLYQEATAQSISSTTHVLQEASLARYVVQSAPLLLLHVDEDVMTAEDPVVEGGNTSSQGYERTEDDDADDADDADMVTDNLSLVDFLRKPGPLTRADCVRLPYYGSAAWDATPPLSPISVSSSQSVSSGSEDDDSALSSYASCSQSKSCKCLGGLDQHETRLVAGLMKGPKCPTSDVNSLTLFCVLVMVAKYCLEEIRNEHAFSGLAEDMAMRPLGIWGSWQLLACFLSLTKLQHYFASNNVHHTNTLAALSALLG